MNIRPRCREWLPLSTQQLRLRNLQAIHAVNIEIIQSQAENSTHCPETWMFYTLHDQRENEAFYKSEKLPLRKQLPLKWAEINCLSIVKSNANCVCIKIWSVSEKRMKEEMAPEEMTEKEEEAEGLINDLKEPISALTKEISKTLKHPNPAEKLVLSWGVYFSGLIPLSSNNEIKCSANSLVFQMNDEFFASPDHFSTENLREQLALNYERYSSSVPKCSIPTPDELTINSPHVSRSSSPTAVDWQRDLMRMTKTRYSQLNCVRSEVRQSYNLIKLLRLQHLQRQRLQTQRECVELTAEIKHLSLRCITKEQLLRKPRTTSIGTSSLTTSSSSTLAATPYHSMGRKLSFLLAEQQRIEPHQLLRAQHLQKQVESLKSKQRLLQSAHCTFLERISKLKEHLDAVTSSRTKLKALLGERQTQLDNDKEELDKMGVQQLERRHRKRSLIKHVEWRMSSLCLELKKIYPIAKSRHGYYTICGVPFPSMEGYVYDSNNPNSVYISENITPMALSASLGYVAHLVEMISVVISCPLRNPIIYEGSHTRIKDTIKDIPSYASREFPLYSRSSIPTKAVKYAVNLLNQNIVQLCYYTTGNRCDIRATVENILLIFKVFSEIVQNKPEMYSHHHHRSFPLPEPNSLTIEDLNKSPSRLTIEEMNHSTKALIHVANFDHSSVKNGKDYASSFLSQSHSSVDIDHMVPPPVHLHQHREHLQSNNVTGGGGGGGGFPLTSENLRLLGSTQPIVMVQERRNQRICRSVGSYTDGSENEDDYHSAVFSISDSNLTQQGGSI